ncbi:hypothetical protein MesoLjLc_45720 [Mesorhizobium sp. L-8-10]|nr:hypothetical protein MesoLjLc_45720 [Mesorhizobium sp. L-8-10]
MVLPVQNPGFNMAPRTLAAPPSVSGKAQVVATDAGIWKVTFGQVVVNNRQRVLAWRAIDNLLEGRLGKILVPFCRAYQPVPTNDGLLEAVPHSDDTPFSDGTEYQGVAMSVRLSGAVAARAVSASITADGGTIEPGQHFSIGERLYRVRTIVYHTTTTATITFRPPLREAAGAGAEMDFDDPVCRMRLASDDAMDLELALRRFGTPTVNFVEDL